MFKKLATANTPHVLLTEASQKAPARQQKGKLLDLSHLRIMNVRRCVFSLSLALLSALFSSPPVALAYDLGTLVPGHGLHGEQADAAFRDAVEDGSRLEVPHDASFGNTGECSGEILAQIKNKDYSFISPTLHLDSWENERNIFKSACKSSDLSLNDSWVFQKGVNQDDFSKKYWDQIGTHYIIDRSVDIYEMPEPHGSPKIYFVTIGSGLLSHLDKSMWFSDDMFKIVLKKKNSCTDWLSRPTLGAVGMVKINNKPFLFNITSVDGYSALISGNRYRESLFILNITERQPAQCIFLIR